MIAKPLGHAAGLNQPLEPDFEPGVVQVAVRAEGGGDGGGFGRLPQLQHVALGVGQCAHVRAVAVARNDAQPGTVGGHHEAGVAQGTFYLYFETKNDVLLAVVEEVAEQLLMAISVDLGRPDLSPEARLLAFGTVLTSLSRDSSLADVADFIHRPENQQLHDRFAEHFVPRLVPLIEQVIADGVADVINIKPSRVGGYLTSRQIHDVCLANGVPVFCGGTLETAIGRAANLALAEIQLLRDPLAREDRLDGGGDVVTLLSVSSGDGARDAPVFSVAD